MFVKQIGKELKSVRVRKSLTLEEASKIIGIHKNMLSIYENQPQKLKLGKLFEILDKYEVNIDIFFENVCEYIHENETQKEKEE